MYLKAKKSHSSIQMTTSIDIIGAGRLGCQIAYHALQGGICKVYLSSRDYHKTSGIAADFNEVFGASKVIPVKDYQLPERVDYTFFTFSTLIPTKAIQVNDRIIDCRQVCHQRVRNSPVLGSTGRHVFRFYPAICKTMWTRPGMTRSGS